MLSFLLLPIAPYLIAAVILALGYWAWRARGRCAGAARIALAVLAVTFTGLGVLMVFGASTTLYLQAAMRRAHPPPGKIVDVGGLRLHVWCEGPRTSPTILLIGGGRSQGVWMRPLQMHLSSRWRACVVDRAGLGWSGPGHVPVTIDDDLEQFHGALASTGEQPAAAVIGHSGGGEMAINYAGAYPDEVKALVLLDPSEPSHSLVDWRGSGLKVKFQQWMPVFATLYGLPYVHRFNPFLEPDNAWMRGVFRTYWEPATTWELRPSSIIEGLSSHGAVRGDPFSIVRTPGALSRQTILLITQLPEAPRPPPGVIGRRAKNYANLLDYARREALYLSRDSKLIYAPPDSTHYFLYTQQKFTHDHVSRFLETKFPQQPTAAPAD